MKQKSMPVQAHTSVGVDGIEGDRRDIIIPAVTMQVHLGTIPFHLLHSGIPLAFNDLSDEAILTENQRNIGQYFETNWYQFTEVMQPEWRMIGINKQLIFRLEVGSQECMYSIHTPWDSFPKIHELFNWIHTHPLTKRKRQNDRLTKRRIALGLSWTTLTIQLHYEIPSIRSCA